MAKTKSKGRKNKKEVSSESDDGLYENDFDEKNPFSDDDIESFHKKRDKVLLNDISDKGKNKYKYSSDEEEVLAFEDDESENEKDYDDDDDDNENDEVDGKDQDDDVPNTWGRKKSAYYSGNKIQNDEDALLEEEEANKMQAKMMKQLDTSDFGLDDFKLKKNVKILKSNDDLESNRIMTSALGENDFNNEENFEKIVKNLSKMSKKEKLEFLQQESPELLELVRDFKLKIKQLQEELIPIMNAVKNGQIPQSPSTDYIINKTKLYLIFCSHLSFYFVLKSQRLQVENHPIVKNILQYRNLCKQISTVDDKLAKEIKFINDSLKTGQQLFFKKTTKSDVKKLKKSVKFRDSISRTKRDSMRFEGEEDESENELEMEQPRENVEVFDENPGSSKRGINYQIEKNKGLTPKRDKTYRNPRVRNRMKARKATIKRKSIVPKVREQDKRYSGEATGIRTGIVRAVKIK